MELKNVKTIRNRLGITQQQLARSAEVSQSMIAKIESGRLDPAHGKALKIFAALESFSKKEEKKAADLMTKAVITASLDNLVKDIVKKLKAKGISQIPIVSKDIVVGMISESTVVENFGKITGKTKVSEIMGPAPPQVPWDTPVSAVASLLKFAEAVLVVEKGNLKGIITKADLL